MDAKEFRSLQEAYMEVVENQQLDELSDRTVSNALNARIAATGAASDRAYKHRNPEAMRAAETASGKEASMRSAAAKRRKRKLGEEMDIYDIILSHLLDEGYADTEQAAEAIMVNMSEEWRESIVDEVLDEGKKEFPSDRVRNQSAKHERDSIANGNPKSRFKARKMKAIASTVEVGGDPRNTMHGQDLRKLR